MNLCFTGMLPGLPGLLPQPVLPFPESWRPSLWPYGPWLKPTLDQSKDLLLRLDLQLQHENLINQRLLLQNQLFQQKLQFPKPVDTLDTWMLIPDVFDIVITGNIIELIAKVPLIRGQKFLPSTGTARFGMLPKDATNEGNQCPPGSHDSVVQCPNGQIIRQCNWVRFIGTSSQSGKEANIIWKIVNGTPVYEVVSDLLPGSRLITASSVLPKSDSPPAPTLSKKTTEKLPVESPADVVPQIPDTSVKSETPLDLTVLRGGSPTVSSTIRDGRGSASSEESVTSRLTAPPSFSSPCKESPGVRHKNLLPCHVCGKAFDRPSLLSRHMRTHTGEKPHCCDVCGKGFSTSSSLNTHRRIHSGEKPHQCPVCGKRFTASSNLYYHRLTHVKEKPHKCTHCGKSFPTPGDLRAHAYVHSGMWPFRCPVCGRGFGKATNLRNHLLLHSGDKPHACDLCPKRFALACNLRAHMKTHDEPQETCSRCEKVFAVTAAMPGAKECSSCRS